MSAQVDCVIIGAGAAGLYCAMHAGRRGRRVLVIEHNAEPGAKILISGGGRCNFTNVSAGDPARFISANPHFARSALARHKPADFIALIEKHGIAYYEKTLGQLFCDGARSSQKVVKLLMDECAAVGVEVRTNCRVTSLSRGERFELMTSQGAISAETCVIATGALSIPKLGATGFAYDIARQFNIPIVATRPGLVPLTFRPADREWMQHLSGVAAEVAVSCGKTSFREAALFTHRGLSGPAILQISSYLKPGAYLNIDWLPDQAADFLVAAKRERPRALPKTILAQHLPDRLAATLAAQHPPRELGDWKDDALISFAQRTVKQALLRPAGDEGYAKAEVSVGGVDTNALSQQTMETRVVPGLFFVGEAVDVTGWLGGYNFQWAWSSGWAAGQAC
ncbi:NAD(P)/FAD-dependent oxidoreductase [Terricaulis sp.]|uniref:NAD(P)/FAD-dependent oxidoreductase n=1 Tax=Terricaulis sp. TaxID=2768686 RepID=UPI003783F54F